MRFLRKGLILFLSISAGYGADKDAVPFKPGPASSYPNHQTISKLTVAAHVVTTPEETQSAFGKLEPAKYGVLPVLLVMQNDSDKALRLSRMRVEYIRPDKRPLEPIPANEVQYLGGIRKPKTGGPQSPLPLPRIGRGKKNPLAAFEIEGRAFAAEMLPPGDSASGFIYFNTAHYGESILFITGIYEASTGQELFYYEIPLD